MMEHAIPRAFKPLADDYRYKVFYGGRGGAKSWAFADVLLLRGYDETTRILCAREIQKSIKESVHGLLQDRINALGLGHFYTVTDGAITGKNGTRFFFEGLLRNIESIKSIEGIDVCWIEEAAPVSENSFKTLIPTIRKEGSEIWVSFNPRLKSDPVYQRFILNPPSNSHIQKVSWRDNPHFPDVLRQEMEDLKERDFDEYLHIWEGELKKFADGAVFGRQMRKAYDENRIFVGVPVENVPVHTSWDLGRNDHTAIWFFQEFGGQVRFIDYYENRLYDLDHYAGVVLDKARENGYIYGDHYLPHDVEHIVIGAGNRSRREILEGFGVKPVRTVPRVSNKNESIEAARDMMPRCIFDAEACEAGLEALSNYKFEYDEKNDTHQLRPKHDRHSNGADAFQQAALGFRGDNAGYKSQVNALKNDELWTYKRRRSNKYGSLINPSTSHIV